MNLFKYLYTNSKHNNEVLRMSLDNIRIAMFSWWYKSIKIWFKRNRIETKKDNLVFWKLFYLFGSCSKENDYLSCENEKQWILMIFVINSNEKT